MTDAAHPVEPIAYRNAGDLAAGAGAGPPGVLRVLAATSIVVAVATVALAAFAATRAYYTAPPRPSPRRTTPAVYAHRPAPPRVTVAEGAAVLDGVSKVISLTPKQRDRLREALLRAEGQVKVEVGPDPTPEKIAAEARDSGKLFGEDGAYAVIGRVRVEATDERVKVAGVPGNWPMIEHSVNRTSYRVSPHSPTSTWYFVPPPPDPATQRAAAEAAAAAATPQRGPLELEIRRLAPHVLGATDAAISAPLAILLLVAAIGLWNFSRRARRLHLLWAALKLPLALAAAAGYFWVTLGGKLELSGGATPVTKFVLRNPEFVTSLLVALYALTVLVVLNLPNVRRYFRAPPEFRT